jgi:glycosidase
VDGFRLDAIRYLVENGAGLQQDQPETHAALKELAASVRAAQPDAVLLGEAWADAATIAGYFGSTATVPGGDEIPLPLDFPVADAVVTALASGASGATAVAGALDQQARSFPAGGLSAHFLTNHDQQRVATRVNASSARLGLGAAILLTLQGTPVIYYGEEIGMLNGTCSGDECKRTPMAWDASAEGGFTSGTPWWPLAPGWSSTNVSAEMGDPSSLLARYRQLVRVRKASPALRRGGTQRLSSETSGVLSFLRVDPAETVLVAHNLGTSSAERELAVAGAAADVLFADPGAVLSQAAAGWKVSLPASSSGVWRLR